MNTPKVLIVDDDASIVKFIQANLKADGYETLAAADGETAIQMIEKELPDLVLLDIMMPRIYGFEVLRRLREWSTIPVIMLSARGDERDKVRSLDLGADDYLTKPFGVQELLARVRAVLRRAKPAEVISTIPSFTCEHFQIDFKNRKVTARGREVKLTPTEYNLLKEMALNADKLLTHQMLLNKIWGPEYSEEKEYLHVFIGRLRKELEPDPENPRYLITVPGVGYKLRSSPETKPEP